MYSFREAFNQEGNQRERDDHEALNTAVIARANELRSLIIFTHMSKEMCAVLWSVLRALLFSIQDSIGFALANRTLSFP